MDEEERKALYASVRKKATGYEATETQEEYALVDGEMTMVKRKITRKDVPPDISALKLLLGEDEPQPVGCEELERERKELTEAYWAHLQEAGMLPTHAEAHKTGGGATTPHNTENQKCGGEKNGINGNQLQNPL